MVEVALTLDPDAAARVPDLADQLVVDDLVVAGWDVRGPAVEEDGRTVVRARKPFRTVEQASEVLAELTGAEGPVRGLRVERATERLETTYTLSGTLDLEGGIEAFSDLALEQRLDGTRFGLPTPELEASIGRPLGEAVGISVIAELPGSGRDVTTGIVGSAVPIEASGTVRNDRRATLLLLAAGAGGLAVVTGLAAALRRRRTPPRRSR